MALQQILVPDNPDIVFTTILDGVSYDMRIQWNGRDEAWYLYLAKQNTEYTFKTKITTNTDLVKIHRANDNCPKGILIAIDNMKRYGRINRVGWNTRFNLYYYPKQDKDTLAAFLDATEELNFSVDTTEDTRFTKSAIRL